MENVTQAAQTPFEVLFSSMDNDAKLLAHVKKSGFVQFQKTLTDLVSENLEQIKTHYANLLVEFHNAIVSGSQQFTIAPMDKPDKMPVELKTWQAFYQSAVNYAKNDKSQFKAIGNGDLENFRNKRVHWNDSDASKLILTGSNGVSVTITKADYADKRYNGTVYDSFVKWAAAVRADIAPEGANTQSANAGFEDRVGKHFGMRGNDTRQVR